MNTLIGSAFKDLYIGENFADVKDLDGAQDALCEAPANWAPEVNALRVLCQQREEELGIPEFSVIYENVVFRVTNLDGAGAGSTYSLRRSAAEIRDVRGIGLSKEFVAAVLEPRARGIVLISGDMGVGKTTTAASFVVARLKAHGGVGLAIEDPQETNIGGRHGQGRCIPVAASRHRGGYAEHLIRGLRSSADFIFIGEIRDSETAYEVVKAGLNGSFIISTIHGGGITDAIERLIDLASQHTDTAAAMLSNALYAVVWQDLVKMDKQSGGTFKRLESSSLIVDGETSHAIRQAIRTNSMPALEAEIERQASKRDWRGGASGFSS